MARQFKRVSTIGVIVLLTLVAGTDVVSAGSSLPPLSSIQGTAFPSSGLQSQDSCSSNQYNDSSLPSIDKVDLRGFRVNLLGPLTWSCQIGDGNGSGAAITFGETTPVSSPTKDSITVVSSANVLDNGGDFCAYTRVSMPSWSPGSCRGRRGRPTGEEVKYLRGGPDSKSFVVLIADPAGLITPWAGQVAKEPTITVLAASATSQGAFDLICSIGTKLSSMCITDANQFASAYWSQV
jgi:hypothetical protein